MPTWTLSLRTAPESGLPSVDVVVLAREDATVADLADQLGRHLAPEQHQLQVVPLEGDQPWPPDRPLAECGLNTGDLVDVVVAGSAWRERSGALRRPRAVVRVVAGPDRGHRTHVRGSSLTLGRGQHCTVRLTDPLVSQRHARIDLGVRPTVHDEGSANGTTVAGERVVAGREFDWGVPVRIGATTLVVDRGDSPAEQPAVAVFRPPRFGDPLAEGVLELPSPPAKVRPTPLPWAMLALPMVMGLALFSRTRTAFALIYMLAWPVMGYLGWRQQRRAAERQFQEELADWRTDVDGLLTTIDDAAARQRQRLEDDYPATDVVRQRAAARDRYLWARAAEREGFLTTRLGTGTVPALLTGSIGDGGDRTARRGVVAELARRDHLAGLPVVADLAAHPLVAVTGAPAPVDALVRAALLRLAFDHSPADLSVAACLGRGRAGHEAWLRWLPHVTARIGGEAPVAIGPQASTALLDRLVSEDGQRGHTICLVDEDAGVPRRTVEAVAAEAGARQLHLVWLGRTRDEVPAATSLLVDLDQQQVASADRTGVAGLDVPDDVSLHQAWQSARTMTGYVDEAAVLPPSTAIPSVVRLPDLSSDFEDLDETTAVLRRWQQARGLRAQIGTGVDGVVTLDLRDDGPHGLVAGTTGSGKSELLQSLICSLALNNAPSRINFLLVDYKGGAAFRECAELPHTVGYITDLTPALVARGLTSLGAEITAREHLLAEYGVKDLVQLEAEHPEVAPPSLLICVDEFAALTAEVPEFVDGMVNIAQRGRSLGMHLLLATQRPAGVVTGNIRANSDLRISLRVSSADDSRDVIDTPEAARISRRTPGRAWIRRTGHGTAELVQSAWTGARARLRDDEPPVLVHAFSAEDQPATAAAGEGRLDPRTDLERCVATIRRAFAQSGAATPKRPWLPTLPEELVLDDLAVAGTGRRSGRLVVGRVDEPDRQAQPELLLDLATVGHLLVHGASGSGKTELLRTVAAAASLGDATGESGTPPYLYAIDHAGGGLAVLSELPTVEAVIPGTQTGRVLRLIRLLRRTAEERTELLADRGCADLDDLAALGVHLPRVYVLVDNLPSLVEGLEGGGGVAPAHAEQLRTVLQVGRRVGIHVVATAPGRTGVPTAVAASFGRRLVLRMTTTDDYLLLGVPGNVLDADSPAGSGLLEGRQVQVGTTGGAGSPRQAEHLRRLAERLADRVRDRGRAPVPSMPARLEPAALPAPAGARVTIAVDADAVSVLDVDLLAGPVLVAGRARSGRTSALEGLAQLVRGGEDPPRIVRARSYDDALAGVEGWLAAPAAPAAESWCLLLADDVDAWPPAGEARDRLLGLLEEHRGRVALVLTADVAAARQRGTGPGLVELARAQRRGFLLQPEWGDGDVLGVTVPTKTSEPLSGPGRGLWCDGGATWVAQLVGADPVAAAGAG
ncbi:FtsK/SpoIIIE domain-containing protein [Nocardioides sp. QY071]|uniref:FtsK/SpoIIIE domain-containing protein n=1 Tax=Nocardioides sp. QY071 TaxID=3044187 RepID=UPI00249A7333|nr:FtsK/SpoIIIE domain-containing protein [Nocardioides sp. QY071]WGY00092.1 FtsK/SpoIIIE domain-containing protein [Nocardioides sp. QY071]